MVFAAAQAGDTIALQVIDRAVKMPARAVAIIALVLNPELIVLGGAIAHAGDNLLAPFSKALTGFTRMPPRLEVSSLAEHGVLIGGIRQALDEIERHVLDRLCESRRPTSAAVVHNRTENRQTDIR